MIALGLALALTVAQGTDSSALNTARAALAAGDTARAVRVLEWAEGVNPAMGAQAVAALAALQWIGQSPTQDHAGNLWRHASGRKLPRHGLTPSAIAFVALRAVLDGEHPDLTGMVPGNGVGPYLQRMAAGKVEPAPLLAGAALWTLARSDLELLDRRLHALFPVLSQLPFRCRHVKVLFCVIPERANPDWAPHALVAADTLSLAALARLRDEMARLLHAPWPYDELGARAWIAAEAFLGDRGTQRIAEDSILAAGIDPKTTSEMAVIVDNLAHRRAAADSVMRVHLDWYTPLDDPTDALQVDSAMSRALLWRTAWPLYLKPFNERLVVHRARRLLGDLVVRIADSDSGGFAVFADRRTIIADGLPEAVVTLSPSATAFRIVRVVRYLDPRLHETILPITNGAAIRLDMGLAASVEGRSPSGFVAEAYDRMERLPHQVVEVFRDGRPHVQIFEYFPVNDRPCRNPDPRAGFFLLDDHLGMLTNSVDSTHEGTSRALDLPLAPRDYVYSLEMLDANCRLAERARYVLAVKPDTGQLLSDLALADPLGPRATTRVSASGAVPALPTLTIRAGRPVALYWEVYGVQAGGPESGRLAVSLSVVDTRHHRVLVRWLDAVAQAGKRDHAAIDVAYRATVPPGSGPLGMRMAIGLSPDASGVYVARVSVTDRKTGRHGEAERWFFVVPSAN